MAYFHGIRASEVPTSLIPPVNTTAGLPVVWGTAPVHLTEDPQAYVNKPVICYEYGEAVKALGYSGNWKDFTLCESMYSEFQLYGVKPIIFINVLDPKKHKTAVPEKAVPLVSGVATITDPVIKSTLVVKDGIGGTKLVENEDYIAEFNDDGELLITDIAGGPDGGLENFAVSYDKVDASKVTVMDIIGGVSQSGEVKGLEWASSIYMLFSMVPGILVAPGWSQDPTVASVMKAKALTLCGLFRCIVLTDVDTEEAKSYADVNVWKNQNNYTGTNQIVCWPCVRNGETIYHMSTQLMGTIGIMDASNEDIPYESPSNRTMQVTGACLADGTEVTLTLEQANMLNAQGIVTAINFSGGWKSWGNYTGAYPSVTDPKDCFICVRRFFDWQYQTFILTYWQKVDRPLMPRLIKSIVNSEAVRLNGLGSRGFLLGADIRFLESENPLADLMQGIFRVHSYITPPVPMQECNCIFEYNVDNFKALFEAA